MNKGILLNVILLFVLVSGAQSQENHGKEKSDAEIKAELEQIGTQDQTLRLLLPEVQAKFGNESTELKYFWSLINQQDSINEIAVTKLIDNYGWVGKDRVGEEANQSLWLVIQHAPLEIQEKYLPLLRESVNERQSQGWHLAFLEDRILMRNGKKQVYGTQSRLNKRTGQVEIVPIENFETVNERRRKIGLEPIEEYAEKNNYRLKQQK